VTANHLLLKHARSLFIIFSKLCFYFGFFVSDFCFDILRIIQESTDLHALRVLSEESCFLSQRSETSQFKL